MKPVYSMVVLMIAGSAALYGASVAPTKGASENISATLKLKAGERERVLEPWSVAPASA